MKDICLTSCGVRVKVVSLRKQNVFPATRDLSFVTDTPQKEQNNVVMTTWVRRIVIWISLQPNVDYGINWMIVIVVSIKRALNSPNESSSRGGN